MKIILTKFSATDSNKSDCPLLFENGQSNRKWGKVSNGSTCFKLSWRSDTIDPLILSFGDGVHLIGVDQNLAIADFDKGEVLLNIDLDYIFIDAILHHESVFVITELEVIQIDVTNCIIVTQVALPDLYEEMTLCEDGVQIQCFDGQIVLIKI